MTNFFKHKMRRKSPGEIAGWILLGIIAVAGLAILFGYIIMWLWNWLMPDLFGLSTINYWQAVGYLYYPKSCLAAVEAEAARNLLKILNQDVKKGTKMIFPNGNIMIS